MGSMAKTKGTPESIRAALVKLRKEDKKWREIAEMPEYAGVPFGTLCAIGKGYPVPAKWYDALNVAKDPRRRHRISVDAETHALIAREAAAAGVTMGQWVKEKVR